MSRTAVRVRNKLCFAEHDAHGTYYEKTFQIHPWHLATYCIENYTSNYNHLSVWWANLCAYVTPDAVTAMFVLDSGSCNMQGIVL